VQITNAYFLNNDFVIFQGHFRKGEVEYNVENYTLAMMAYKV